MSLYQKEIDNGQGNKVNMRFQNTTNYFGCDVDGKEAVVQIPKKEFIEFLCSVYDITYAMKRQGTRACNECNCNMVKNHNPKVRSYWICSGCGLTEYTMRNEKDGDF